MKILDVRTRPPFGSIRDGMFNNPGRELFEPEAFAPRFGMSVGESARQRSRRLFIEEMDAAGITSLSKLPSKEELLAKMMGSLNAPVTNFVGVLAAIPRGLVCALNAIAQQKEA